jgi:hypothetical protein
MNELSNTKLVALLSSFTRSEWRDFRRFLQMAISGPVGKSVELYDVLSDYFPDFSAPELSRKFLFDSLFKNHRYEDKKLRYAMTDLFRQAGNFLKFKAVENDQLLGHQLLSAELAKRGADKPYLAMYKEDALSDVRDAGFYYFRYREEFDYLNLYHSHQKRSTLNPIATVAKNLDIFFIARKLQLLCEIVNVKNVMSVEYDFFLRDQIIEVISNGAFADVPVITIYFRILMTLTEPENVQHFNTLNDLLIEHNNLFERNELRDMYQYLMNYCIKKINQGDGDYVFKLFEIYKTILSSKVIFTEEYLSQWDFKNIVVIGLRAGQKDWVKQFMDENKHSLLPSESENAYVYNLAYYYFHIADYRKTISLLQKVEFTDLYYQLDMRAILLKCYFEMDDQETFFYHASAFRMFLSRNKLVSDYQRTIYRNMIKYATKIVKSDGNKDRLKKLSAEIKEVKQIADLNWIRKVLAAR